MKIICELLLSLSVMLSLAQPSVAQEKKYQSVIKGRVIDEQGQTVENASVRLDVPKSLLHAFCGAKAFWATSDKEGNFIFEEQCGVANRTVVIYIVPPVADNVKITIYPPFDAPRHYNVNFAGLPVIINGNENVNLGNVPVQIYYNTIDLFILAKTGKPYYKTRDEWAKFALLLRDKNGEFAYGTTLSNKDKRETVDVEKGSIRMALPEGTWKLELLKDLDDYDNETDKAKIILGSTTVTLSKSDNANAPNRIVVGKCKK